jgi:Holliday junction resolvase RusA-like endonuclease
MTRDPITISLLGEPIAFARSRISRGGTIYTPTPQRNYMAALRNAADAAMSFAGEPPFDEPIHLELVAELGVPASWSKKKQAQALLGLVRPAKRPDLSNLLKLAEDALNSVVFRDDCLIVSLYARKVFGVQPKCVITVRPAVLARPGELPLREAAA